MKITLDCFHFKFYKDVSSRELPFRDLIKATRLCSQKEESNDIISTMELQHVTIYCSHGHMETFRSYLYQDSCPELLYRSKHLLHPLTHPSAESGATHQNILLRDSSQLLPHFVSIAHAHAEGSSKTLVKGFFPSYTNSTSVRNKSQNWYHFYPIERCKERSRNIYFLMSETRPLIFEEFTN